MGGIAQFLGFAQQSAPPTVAAPTQAQQEADTEKANRQQTLSLLQAKAEQSKYGFQKQFVEGSGLRAE